MICVKRRQVMRIYSRPMGERRNFTGLTGFYKIYRIILEWQGIDSFQLSLNYPKIIP